VTIGEVYTDHVVPFQESASIEPGVCKLVYQPKTVQDFAEVHDTPLVVPVEVSVFQTGSGTISGVPTTSRSRSAPRDREPRTTSPMRTTAR
jgi:hypothetical protein